MRNTELVHTDDPATSHIAADALNDEQRSEIKDAILMLLRGWPRTASYLTEAYFVGREANGWPDCKEDSVAKRLSELVKAKKVYASDRVTGEYGRPVNVWAVAL